MPEVFLPEIIQNNWAWFVKLRDGTYCSPFTGTRPFFGGDKIAYYGCESNIENEQVILIGDLTKGDIWTANKAVLIKEKDNWAIKFLEQIKIDSVWQ